MIRAMGEPPHMSGHRARAKATMPAPAAAPTASTAVAVGLAALLALALVWAAAALISPTRHEDAVLLGAFVELERPRIDRIATHLTALLNPLPFAVYGLVPIVIAAARGRPRLAFAIAAIMLLAPGSADLLKPLLAHSHASLPGGLASDVPQASFPSGHSTAALALVLCALLASPTRLRPALAVAGACFALAIGCSQVLLRRHLPSDVIGGYLVAIFWTALAVASLRAGEHRSRARP
jgi:membrane-associated phospholipid phosphatase